VSSRDSLRARLERLRSVARLPVPRGADRDRPAVGSPHRQNHPRLLDQVMEASLEPDYQVVADRRAARSAGTEADGSSRRAGPRRLATAAVLAAFAVLIVAAVLEDREDEPADALVRDTLISTATERRGELAQLRDDLARVRGDNAELALSGAAAEQERAAAVERLRRVGVASGFQAATGPGLRMVLTDAPAGRGGERIRADDQALLVNGLWEAGAEAISVNGERLTTRSAITTTSVSININRRPLTAPYTLTVIGDRRVLEAELGESLAGGSWLLLTKKYGFGFETQVIDDVALPPAPELLLRTCNACYPNLDRAPSGQQQDR